MIKSMRRSIGNNDLDFPSRGAADVKHTHAEEQFVPGLYLVQRETIAVRERPSIKASIQGNPITFHTNIWISDVAHDPPEAAQSRIWGRRLALDVVLRADRPPQSRHARRARRMPRRAARCRDGLA